MKNKQNKNVVKASGREQILHAAIASFRIEGIPIPMEQALEVLIRVEATFIYNSICIHKAIGIS